jgi:hypothetical protein
MLRTRIFQEDTLYNDFPSPRASWCDPALAAPNATVQQSSQGPHDGANRLTNARQRLQQAHTSYRALLMTPNPDAQRLDEPAH